MSVWLIGQFTFRSLPTANEVVSVCLFRRVPILALSPLCLNLCNLDVLIQGPLPPDMFRLAHCVDLDVSKRAVGIKL